MMSFYSQCAEDRIMYEKYISKITIDSPTYLEMGAMNGIDYSNTYFLEQTLGWTGILIEPHKKNFEQLQKNRPNNKLYNNIVSNEIDDVDYINYETFCLSGVAGILKTIPKSNMETYYENDNEWQKEQRKNFLKVEKMKPVTLTEIIINSGFEKIDFFSLDVEGHEYQVLLSYNWSIPINMFLIENNQFSKDIHKLLETHNYIFMENIGPNSLYILKTFYDKKFNNNSIVIQNNNIKK